MSIWRPCPCSVRRFPTSATLWRSSQAGVRVCVASVAFRLPRPSGVRGQPASESVSGVLVCQVSVSCRDLYLSAVRVYVASVQLMSSVRVKRALVSVCHPCLSPFLSRRPNQRTKRRNNGNKDRQTNERKGKRRDERKKKEKKNSRNKY